MATFITVILKFSDGSYGYLQNSDVSAGSAGEEILTSNAGGNLNQVNGVSAGVAFTDKVVTHAASKVTTQNADSATYMWAYFLGTDGAIVCPILGGGGTMSELPALKKPVTLKTGMQVQAAWQSAGDSATLIAAATVYCTDGTSDVFFVTAVDGSNTELKNKSGIGIGDALAGKTAMSYFAVYPSTLDVNENGGGVSTLWVEATDGTIKALIPPGDGGYRQADAAMKYIEGAPFMLKTNDKIFVNSDT